MRFLAVLLCSALILPAQQAPGTPAPAPASTSQPPIGSGAKAVMTSALDDGHASWAGTGTWFRKTFRSTDTKVTIEGPVRLKEYLIDGKLTLSLKNYLDLVVANNTDISVQRLSLETPKNAIQRAFGVFDPTVNTTFQATRQKTPSTNSLQGANILSQLDQPFSSTYNQLLMTGTQVQSNISASKSSTNNQFNFYNPAYTTTWNTSFTQPLLRNRGIAVNKLPITIARAQKISTEFSVLSTIQGLLVNAENAYWDVISARERQKVQEQALSLADAALKRAQKEVELGATSPLEIYQPQQNYATAEINLVQVKYQLQIAEETLRRQIGADLDPDVRKLPIVLTEDVRPSADEPPLDAEKLLEVARSNRPDLKATQQNINVNDLQIKSSLNSLLPQFNLGGRYQSQGRGGTQFISTPPPGAYIPGGITDAFGQLFGFNYNLFSFNLTLNLPLRDRANTANLADNLVTKKLNVLRERSLEQQIRQDVLTAIANVENSRASVRLALIALDFSRKRSDADQKRYDLGVIDIFRLLDAQNALTIAESNVVNQTVQYRRNLLTLQQRLGTLPQDRGLVIQ
jgi:outer membrane protein TolC